MRRVRDRLRRFGGVAVAVAALGLLGVLTPAARAGSYPLIASGAEMCSIGSFVSNVPGFGTGCADQAAVTAPVTGAADGDRQGFEIDSPNAGLTIASADVIGSEGLDDDYGGGTYWNGGGASWVGGVGPANEDSGPIASQYWGIQIVCGGPDGCASTSGLVAPFVDASSVDLTVEEANGPLVVPSGLWNEAGSWVWNPPGDSWPLSVGTSDPSGVCSMKYTLGANASVPSPSQTPDPAVWHQCPDWVWGTSVDTTTDVPTSGQVGFAVTATNTAGVQTSYSETLDIDNIPPTVTVTPLNDANPGGWAVNHSVTLRVTPSVGPSGMSGLDCSDTVGGTTTPLTLTSDSVSGSYDVTVDGNGSHAVSCQVANNAVDPQGANNTGSASEGVDIDEQPPSLSFAPIDPSNPDQVVVQTGDDESPVAGGSIQIAPAGSNTYTSLPTSFTSNGQLVATIPDSTLAAGPYTVVATATSQVGNTGTTNESVTLPLRTATTSAVSFAKVVGFVDKRVRERVLVGWHYAAKLNKKGKPVKVKVGGHYKTITVIKRADKCTTRRVKVGTHKWKLKTTCVKPHLRYETKLAIRHGSTAEVYGELTSSQGVPVVGQPVALLTVPNNGQEQSTEISTATTNADGGWSAKVPAGPSRTVEAVFAGADTLLPATGAAHLTVPARIIVQATPARLSWSSTVVISGRLKGGYIPRDGVAMRLLIRLPGRKTPYSPVPFRTTAKGTFRVKWSWGTGSGVATYPFSVATTANESDYPFSAAASPRVNVTFGR